MADQTFTYTIQVKSEKLKALGELESKILTLRKAQKELKKTNQENSAEYQKNAIELKKLATEQSSQRKEVLNSTKANLAAKGSMSQLSAELAKNKKAYRELSTEERNNSKVGGKLLKTIQKQDAAIKKLDRSIGNSQRNVGNYGSALKGVGTQLLGALGITAGLAGFVTLLKSSLGTIKYYGKQLAILAGVLNLNVDEVEELNRQAKELGRTYPTLASEVVKLQEAYARLGFSQSEILSLTEATIQGSIALVAQLDQTAELTGAVVRAFDELNASDSPAILDKLTKSTQLSSLNFEKLSTALPKVAGAANALSIPLDTVLSQLGIAQDATQDASIAGTSLRNIYLELAKKGISLEEALNKINTSQNKLNTANELFGKRGAVTALALANNTERTKELATAIEDSAGTTARVARTQIDTFAGAVDGVASAWEGLVLSFQNSEGVLKTVLQNTADALNSLQESRPAGQSTGNFLIRLLGIGKEDREKAKTDFEQRMAEFNKLGKNELQKLLISQAKLRQDAVEEEENLARLNSERQIRIIVNRIAEINKAEKADEDARKKKQEDLIKVQEETAKEANKKLQIETEKSNKKLNEKIDQLRDELEIDQLKRIENLRKAEIEAVNETIANEETKNEAIKLINEKFDIQRKELIQKGIEEQEAIFEKELETFIEQEGERIAREIDDDEMLKERLNEIAEEFENNKLGRQEKSRQAEIKSVKDSVASEKLKGEAILAINKKYDNAQREILKASKENQLDGINEIFSKSQKLFKENTVAYKVLGVAQATIDTYKSANLALASYPPPIGAILAGVNIAVGLANVAKIAGAKFEKGGEIGGRPHSQGGTMIEAEAGEVIINKTSASQFKPILSEINQWGGGVPIGTPIKRMAANGGLVARSSGVSNLASINMNRMSQDEVARVISATIENLEIVLPISEVNKTQTRVKVLETQSGI